MTKRNTLKGRESARKKRPPSKPTCSVPNCGRTAYARKLCQTHHRQLLKTGKVGTIRPYRKRTANTVKFAGLRLSPTCAKRVQQYADDRGTSRGAAIADVLEAWFIGKKKGKGKRYEGP